MKFRALILTIATTFLIAGVVLYSCTRKKVDYLGPEYLSAPAGFSASNLNVTDPVDFTLGNCFVTANFSARVTYTVTFKGRSSGAVKSYTGVNNLIDASSPGGVWNGSNDGLYFFRTGEVVDVTISFLRSDYTLSTTMTIVKERNPFTGNPNLIPLGGINNGYENSNVNPGSFPTQFAFSTAKATPTPYAERVLASSEGIKAINGLEVLRLSGVSAQPDGFFIGGIQHRAGNLNSVNTFMLPNTWTDPSQIYFNVYIYGNGANFATVNLEFHESDLSNPLNAGGKYECPDPLKTENSYNHDPCTDDGWVYALPINFTGWRLVSIKYSDLSKSVSVNNGGSGDGVKEPTRVARIQMGVVATPAFKEAKVIMDYPVISYGAPFDPSK
jgi:hypothetical protein